MSEALLTTAQAALRLGVAETAIKKFIRDGRLPATKHGRDWAIPAEGLATVVIRKPGRKPRCSPAE